MKFIAILLLFANAAFGQVVDLDRPLTNADVLTLLEAGISEDVIVARIRVSPSRFDTSAEGLKRLKEAGAGDALLMAILEIRHQVTRFEPAPAPVVTPVATPVASVSIPVAAPVSVAPSPIPPEPPPYQPPMRSERGWETPKAEMFGGFAFRRLDGKYNAYGFNWALNGNVTSWLGIVGDVSGVYRTESFFDVNIANISWYGVLAGPQFINRQGRVTGFARVLVGATYVNFEVLDLGSESTWKPSYGGGGGLDVGLSEGMAVRVFQMDGIFTKGAGATISDWRISAGIVARF